MCFSVYEEEEEEDYGYGYPGHMRQASLELNVTEAASPRGNNGEVHGVREGSSVQNAGPTTPPHHPTRSNFRPHYICHKVAALQLIRLN